MVDSTDLRCVFLGDDCDGFDFPSVEKNHAMSLVGLCNNVFVFGLWFVLRLSFGALLLIMTYN